MKKFLIAVALVLATIAVQPTVADSGYTLTFIPTLGGCCSGAAAINASGLVVGNAQLSGNEGFRAFLFDGVTLTTLPGLGPGLSSATAINDTGLIAGASAAPITTTQRATLWTNLIPQALATLQTSGASRVHALNAAGQMAGNAAFGLFPTAVTRAVFWPTPSQVVALPDAGGAFNIATAVNLDSAVGLVQLSADVFHAALWTTINGTPQFTDINPFGGSFSRANAMNAAGMIAGFANHPNQTSSQARAVIWSPNLAVTDLQALLPNLTTSTASGINNAGQVVGTMISPKGARAFLYSGGVMIDLNDLVPPGSSWILDRGTAINDAGTIVGVATSVDGTQQRGFILTPNSPAGTAVVAQPIDEGTGTSPVTLTFDKVTSGGATTLTISNTGPNPPEGFSLGDPPTYYDLFTSASFSGAIKICIDYSAVSYSTPGALHLFHYENDLWVDVTTSLDTANQTICGVVTSLSPFAIFQSAHQNEPPAISAGGPYSVGEGGSVMVIASGSDPEGGPLTYAWDLNGDGTFETPGQSTAFSAAAIDGPSQRQISVKAIDNEGLSATATAMITIVNVPPSVGAIAAPSSPIVIGSIVAASASFSDPAPADTHAGVWNWGDLTTSGAALTGNTAAGTHAYSQPGEYTIRLTVTDDDSGVGSAEIARTIMYAICRIDDPSRAFRSGSTAAIKLQLCAADGSNQSSPAIALNVVGLRLVSTNATALVNDSGNANPDQNFRYDATLRMTGGYVYNLSTQGLATGTYALGFVAGSQPYVYEVLVQIR